jgi:periplasmic divalent cation tolerance protein
MRNFVYAMVYITTSGREESEKIANILLEEKLAGCINIIPSIKSIYLWQGEIEADSESILIAKTKLERIDDIIKKVKEIHSYDIPCILAIPVIQGSMGYLEWLESEIG